MKIRFLLMLWLSLSLCACAPLNRRLSQYNYREGYRFGNLQAEGNPDELFIVVALSGGGTRAAAFSYGVLKELNKEREIKGKNMRLLDEVDVISSVSGGSFTSAYYGLFGERLFQDFEDVFLRKNIRLSLMYRVLLPWNWIRMLSPYYSRTDVAAEFYNSNIFEGKTYRDLINDARRPFIILNAANLSLGSVFEFTQRQFDLLQSDLLDVPVARGVAASSAFPGLLAPITLRNFKKRDYKKPQWIKNAIKYDLEVSPRRYKRASNIQAYFDVSERPYIHLVDGGVADNIGLRGPMYSFMFPDLLLSGNLEGITDSRELNIQRMLADRKIKWLVFIIVDAKPGNSSKMDASRGTPGLIKVISAVASAPMENYSFETVQQLKEYLYERKKQMNEDQDNPHKMETYVMHICFDMVKNREKKERLKSLSTDFYLPEEAIDELIETGGDLLKNSSGFKKLLQDLGNQIQ